jgi:hypothetical protein
MSESKFSGIFRAKRGEGAAPDLGPAETPAPVGPQPVETPPLSPAPATTPRRGRPPGKRSDPGFVQVTAYIPAELHHNVKLALLQERKGREFSELVDALLTEWVRSRG